MANTSLPQDTPDGPPPRLRVALFGSGARGLQCLAALGEDPRLDVVGFFDNDPKKWHTTVQGLPVFEPTEARCLEMDAILLASVYARDILAQLTRMGVGHKAVLSPPQLTRRLGGGAVPAAVDDDPALAPAERRARMLALAPADIRRLATVVDADPPAPVSGTPSSAREVACTICCNNYFAYATVLARSFLRHHPQGRFVICLVDRLDPAVDYPHDPRLTIVTADGLGIPACDTLAFKYDVLEFNTAVKPFLLERLFRDHGAERLLYLDPDILVTAPLTPIFDALDASPLVLTPHLRRPYTDDHGPGEIDILRAGTFNLGFVGMAAHPQTWDLLTWWQARLTDGCTREIEKGYFVDQKWMDFVPSFFPDHHILRSGAFNAAYWNLHERTLARDGDTFLVDGEPLRFFHFSGIDVHDLESVSKHQTRWTLPETGALRDLFELYRVLLVTHGQLERRRMPYTYGRFANGVRVPDIVRKVYRDARLSRVYPQPFATGDGSFFEWLRAPWAPGSLLSNLAAALRARAGVAPADGADDEVAALLQLHLDAERYGLPDALVDAAPAPTAPRAPAVHTTRAATVTDPPAVVGRPGAGELPAIVTAALDAAWTRAAGDTPVTAPSGIACWLWDETWPATAQAEPGTEIWVPSSYSLEGAARTATTPVVCMPLAVGAIAPSDLPRDAFGLPDGTRLAVTVLDTMTAPGHDLHATLGAFGDACAGEGPPLRLLVGATSAALADDARRLAAMHGARAVRVDVRHLAPADLVQVLRLADLYLSMHGAVSCDPWMAQALAFGRPAVTTGLTGTADIATVNNSFLVQTTGGDTPRADVAHAAWTIRQAIAYDADRLARGARAQQDLDAQRVDAVATRMARRLARLTSLPRVVQAA